MSQPIVIAHRGASGYVPEHTLAAYALAIEMGADFIEPDLVMARDGVLVARHENEISATTDVASRPEFARRRTTRTIDGVAVEGWFVEEFTLAELSTLRARERLPDIRPCNTRFDGVFPIPTLAEVLALVRAANGRLAKPVGVYPELKHPGHFARLGLDMVEPLLAGLRAGGFGEGGAPVFLQCFEVAALKRLRRSSALPLIQLASDGGRPFDLAAARDQRTYADLLSREGLAEVKDYATGIGVEKSLIRPREADGRLGTPTALVADAHAIGLVVHAWTFRAENAFLRAEARSPALPGQATDPAAPGDLAAEIEAFLAAGIDGLFTDQPDIGRRVCDDWARRLARIDAERLPRP